MTITASQQIDANSRTVTSNEAFVVSKTVAFDGTAGNGAQGSVSLFTVTGDVILAHFFGVCTEDLAGATATISVGTANNTAGIVELTTATDIDNNDVWPSDTPQLETASLYFNAGKSNWNVVANGTDIIATVGTASITNGTLKFYALWRPLSSDGNVVAA